MNTLHFKRLALSLCLAIVSLTHASAMVIESGSTIVIDSVTHSDIYLLSGTVIINAPVHGDLFVAGGKIFINDTVNNVNVVGGTVSLNGYVLGKIRCLGGVLKVGNLVGGDIIAASGEITIEKNAVVLGDLVAATNRLILYGRVDGIVRSQSGDFQLYGTAGGGLDCRGETIEVYGTVTGPSTLSAIDGMIVGGDAAFMGSVRYWSASPVDFGHSLKSGKAISDQRLASRPLRWYFLGMGSWLAVFAYLASAFLVIALLQWLFGNLLQKAGDAVYRHPLRSLGLGISFWLGTPVAIGLALISIIAIPVALVLLMIYLCLIVICGSVVSVIITNWYIEIRARGYGTWVRIWIAFAVFVLFRLVFSTSFLLWLLFPLLACVSVGAILQSIRWKRASTVTPGKTELFNS